MGSSVILCRSAVGELGGLSARVVAVTTVSKLSSDLALWARATESRQSYLLLEKSSAGQGRFCRWLGSVSDGESRLGIALTSAISPADR